MVHETQPVSHLHEFVTTNLRSICLISFTNILYIKTKNVASCQAEYFIFKNHLKTILNLMMLPLLWISDFKKV